MKLKLALLVVIVVAALVVSGCCCCVIPSRHYYRIPRLTLAENPIKYVHGLTAKMLQPPVPLKMIRSTLC